MKNFLSFLAIIVSATVFAQSCGFDVEQAKLEQKFPEIKKARDQEDARILQTDVKAYLSKMGATFKNSLYTGTIYEIPVVINVITSTDASNSSLSLTDAQINTWIDNANKMYATTYGKGFFTEGTGSLNGNVIPFKLVLAKRTPQCTASTGIYRFNGSTIAGYDQYGVMSQTSNGVTSDQIRTLAPHWPENAYFNIYVVVGFDGDKSSYGLLGYCGYPTNPDSAYDSFMKVTVVTNVNDSTLAHEFGHGMGLIHPFDGASSSPGATPTASDCPANANCSTDNDKVCDTSPCASLLSVYPTPTNSATNPCTSANYDGVQYNIMNYTYQPRKFTAGQRDRAMAIFLQLRGNLTKSLGGTSVASDPGAGSLVAANCSPAGITSPGDYGIGPLRVVLGSIDNASDPFSETNNQYFVDYSTQNCYSKSVYTDISNTGSSQLSVSFYTNPQYIKAWIDYNNNGIFESSELIGASPQLSITNSPYLITFTPPTTAVKNTYLRMRVIADYTDDTVCQNLNYGQAEDYSVKIATNTLATIDSKQSNGKLVYSKSENKLTLFNSEKNVGNYEIYDMSGKVVLKGNANKDVFLKRILPKGIYIIKYQNTTQKFTNQ